MSLREAGKRTNLKSTIRGAQLSAGARVARHRGQLLRPSCFTLCCARSVAACDRATGAPPRQSFAPRCGPPPPRPPPRVPPLRAPGPGAGLGWAPRLLPRRGCRAAPPHPHRIGPNCTAAARPPVTPPTAADRRSHEHQVRSIGQGGAKTLSCPRYQCAPHFICRGMATQPTRFLTVKTKLNRVLRPEWQTDQIGRRCLEEFQVPIVQISALGSHIVDDILCNLGRAALPTSLWPQFANHGFIYSCFAAVTSPVAAHKPHAALINGARERVCPGGSPHVYPPGSSKLLLSISQEYHTNLLNSVCEPFYNRVLGHLRAWCDTVRPLGRCRATSSAFEWARGVSASPYAAAPPPAHPRAAP